MLYAEQLKNATIEYWEDRDAISILFDGQPKPSIGHVVDDHLLLRVHPITFEVHGIEIEAVRRGLTRPRKKKWYWPFR